MKDDRFITAYSAWMAKPYVEYLYAHGRIVDHEIFDEPFKMGKGYFTTWELPEEHEIWFILNWGTDPGVAML